MSEKEREEKDVRGERRMRKGRVREFFNKATGGRRKRRIKRGSVVQRNIEFPLIIIQLIVSKSVKEVHISTLFALPSFPFSISAIYTLSLYSILYRIIMNFVM